MATGFCEGGISSHNGRFRDKELMLLEHASSALFILGCCIYLVISSRYIDVLCSDVSKAAAWLSLLGIMASV